MGASAVVFEIFAAWKAGSVSGWYRPESGPKSVSIRYLFEAASPSERIFSCLVLPLFIPLFLLISLFISLFRLFERNQPRNSVSGLDGIYEWLSDKMPDFSGFCPHRFRRVFKRSKPGVSGWSPQIF